MSCWPANKPKYRTPPPPPMNSADRQFYKGDCKQLQHISVHTYSGTAPSEYGEYVNVPLNECLMIHLTPLRIIS